MLQNPRLVISRDRTLEKIWGYAFTGEANIIEVYIRALRMKLEASNSKRLLHTVRGRGYVLREQKWGGADLQIPGICSMDTGEPAPQKCESHPLLPPIFW